MDEQGHDTKREPVWVRCGDTTERDRRNLRKLLGACIIWLGALFLAVRLVKVEAIAASPLAWGIAALPFIAGVFIVIAYMRFLREVDELQRMIQMRALALGFGGAFCVISGYSVFEKLGAPPMDVGATLMVMSVSYALGSLLGWRAYR